MRILQVTESMRSENGGPPRVVGGLSRALAHLHVKCEIATTSDSDQEVRLEVPQVKTHFFRTTVWSRAWTGHSSELDTYLHSEGRHFDLFHIHGLWHHPHFAAFRAARALGKPYIVTIHGQLNAKARSFRRLRKAAYWHMLQRRILEGASALHVCTQDEAAEVDRLRINRPICVIPNGIFSNDIPGSTLQRKDNLPALKGRRAIVYLGRLHPIKGIDLLCQAYAKLRQRPGFEDTLLVLAGPPTKNYQKYLEGVLSKESVSDSAVFLGLLTPNEAIALLRSAHVFVLASRSEGFSISVLEALACSVPVIISRHCSFPEVEASGAGVIVDLDSTQLADALVSVLVDETTRSGMGANARRLIESTYDWSLIVQRFGELYRKAMSL